MSKKKSKEKEDPDEIIPPGERLLYSSLIYGSLDDDSFHLGQLAAKCFKTCHDCKASSNLICYRHLRTNYNAYLEFQAALALRNIGGHSAVLLDDNRQDDKIKRDMPQLLLPNWVPFQVPGDGNCGFSSVSTALILDPALGKALRRCCLLEFLTNQTLYQKCAKVYGERRTLRILRNDGEWANDIIIYLMSKVIQRTIVVIWKEKGRAYYNGFSACGQKCTLPPIFIYNYKPRTSQAHFVPIFPVEEDDLHKLFLHNSPPKPPFRTTVLRGKEVSAYHKANPISVEAALEIWRQRQDPANKDGDFSEPKDKLLEPNQKIHRLSHNNESNKTETSTPNLPADPATEKCKVDAASDKTSEQRDLHHQKTTAAEEEPLKFYSCEDLVVEKSAKFLRDAVAKRMSKPLSVTGVLFSRVLKVITDRIQVCLASVDNEKQILVLLEAFHGTNYDQLHSAVTESVLAKRDNTYIHNRCQEIVRYANYTESKLEIINALVSVKAPTALQNAYAGKCGLSLKPIPKSKDAEGSHSIRSDAVVEDDDEDQEEETFNESTEAAKKKKALSVLCNLLHVSEEQLQYQPPAKFSISIESRFAPLSFDFKEKRFIKYEWEDAFSSAFITAGVPCAFNASGSPDYHAKKTSSFCSIRGYCGCGMHFKIEVHKIPVEGENINATVETSGAFTLRPTKSTSRAIRGHRREQTGLILQKESAFALFLQNRHHLRGLRALHRNEFQKTAGVLRNIKSETKTKESKGKSLDDQTKDLQQKFSTVYPDKDVKGFIHLCSLGNNIRIHCYDFGSLELHKFNLTSGFTTVHVDATSSLFKNPSDKQVLVYVLLGKNMKNETWPVAEMISQHGNQVAISNFVEEVYYALNQISNVSKPLADMSVCDFSYAIIHGLLHGINHETIRAYIRRCHAYLTGKVNWDKQKSIVFICTSHLFKAFKVNLHKRLSVDKKTKPVIHLALYALARLQECFSWEEFVEISEMIVRVFCVKKLTEAKLDDYVSRLKTKKAEREIFEEKTPEQPLIDECYDVEKFKRKSLKECSEFYHEFYRIRLRVEDEVQEENYSPDAIRNPFFCPTIAVTLETYKIPLFPLWSSAVPRKVRSDDFLRESNAHIESHFGLKKKKLGFSKENSYVEYLDKGYEYFDGLVVGAGQLVDKEQSGKKQPPPKKPTEVLGNMRKEKWARKGRNSKKKDDKSTYLSDKSTLQPSTKSSSSRCEKSPPRGETSSSKNQSTSDDSQVPPIPVVGRALFVSAGGQQLNREEISEMVFDSQWLTSFQVNAYLDHVKAFYGSEVYVTDAHALFTVGEDWSGLFVPGMSNMDDFSFENSQSVKFLLHPFRYNNHFVAILMDIEKKECWIHDSQSVTEPIKEKRILAVSDTVIPIMLGHLGIAANTFKDWKTDYGFCPKQTGASECGVFMLKVAEELILNPAEPDIPFRIDPTSSRWEIIITMLRTTTEGRAMLEETKEDISKLRALLLTPDPNKPAPGGGTGNDCSNESPEILAVAV